MVFGDREWPQHPPGPSQVANMTTLNLICELLGTSAEIASPSVLPKDVKFVFMAVGREQGPLSEILMISRLQLCDEAGPPHPVLLSVLPRSQDVWVSRVLSHHSQIDIPAIRLIEARYVLVCGIMQPECKCSAILLDSSRTQFSLLCSAGTPYMDLQPATEWGCTAFLALGTSMPSRGISVAVMLGLPKRSDCSPSTARAIIELLEIVSRDCGPLLDNFLRTSDLVAATTQDHCTEGQDFDFEFIGEQGSLSAVPYRDLSFSGFNLEFSDRRLEDAFTAEHTSASLKLDFAGFLGVFSALAWVLFYPVTKFHQPGMAEGVQIWRWLISYLPCFLLLTRNTRRLYCRHRELLLVYYFTVTMFWNQHMTHFLTFLSAQDFLKPVFLFGYGYLPAMMLLFQMRFRFMKFVALGCYLAEAALFPNICVAFYPQLPCDLCIIVNAAWTGFWAVAVPLLLLWVVEKRARENFRRRVGQQTV